MSVITKQKIESLLARLEVTNKADSQCNESKNIRRKLRKLGHKGALKTRQIPAQ